MENELLLDWSERRHNFFYFCLYRNYNISSPVSTEKVQVGIKAFRAAIEVLARSWT
jgi:hypothetical protein